MTLADQIIRDRGQPATVRVGTVTAVSPLKVAVQETELLNVGSLTPDFAVGDVVALLGQSAVSADGSSWLALGSVIGADLVTSNTSAGLQVMASVQANNTGVFADITGVTFTFVKTRPDSRVFLHLAGSSFTTGVATNAEFALRTTSSTGLPAAVDNVVASFFYNVATTHLSWCGFRYLSGLPVGTYTIQGRFRLSAGAGSISFDTNDRISVAVTEMF